MEYRALKKTDIKASFLGFGCWAIGGSIWNGASDKDSQNAISYAVDEGINFFDVAPVYGLGFSETLLGKSLKGKRDKVYLATKCGLSWTSEGRTYNDLSPSRILSEINESLSRLETDYVDIYQLHWPDPQVSIEAIAETMLKIIASGKVRYFGLSNFSLVDVKKFEEFLPVVSFQGLFNMLEWDSQEYHSIPLEYKSYSEILPYCEKQGIGFLPYSPLMQGLLTGSFKADPKENFDVHDVRAANPRLGGELYAPYYQASCQLLSLAQDTGYTLIDLAYMWLKSFGAVVSVISGAQNSAQVKANLSACEKPLQADLLTEADKVIRHNLIV